MPDTVLNALKQKLERYEAAGMPDEVKRVKARIAQEEKAPTEAAKAAALPMTLSPTPVAAVTAPKPTVKKTAAKRAAKKK